MGTEVEKGIEYSMVAKALVKFQILTKQQADAWHVPLEQTYDQVLALHRKSWNGIWFKIVRNFFWSATGRAF